MASHLLSSLDGNKALFLGSLSLQRKDLFKKISESHKGRMVLNNCTLNAN